MLPLAPSSQVLGSLAQYSNLVALRCTLQCSWRQEALAWGYESSLQHLSTQAARSVTAREVQLHAAFREPVRSLLGHAANLPQLLWGTAFLMVKEVGSPALCCRSPART